MTHAFPWRRNRLKTSCSLLPLIKHLLRVLECLDFLLPLGHTLRVCLLSLNAHWLELLELCKGIFLELGGITFVLLSLHKLIFNLRDTSLFGVNLILLVFVVSLGIRLKSFLSSVRAFSLSLVASLLSSSVSTSSSS